MASRRIKENERRNYQSAPAEEVIASVVPLGGSINQVLSKASSADHDTEWATVGSGVQLVAALTADAAVTDASTICEIAAVPAACTAICRRR